MWCGGASLLGLGTERGSTWRWHHSEEGPALPIGTATRPWAGGTHCTPQPPSPPAQPQHQAPTNKERALRPPRENEILNLISRKWIPCTCLCS